MGHNTTQHNTLKQDGENKPSAVSGISRDLLKQLNGTQTEQELENILNGINKALPQYQDRYQEDARDIIGQALTNSTLTDEERLSQAQSILGVDTLTNEQQNAIIQAHKYGTGTAFAYDQPTLIAKGKILMNNSNFTREQAQLLLDYGICGKGLDILIEITRYIRHSIGRVYADKDSGGLIVLHLVGSLLIRGFTQGDTNLFWLNAVPSGLSLLGGIPELLENIKHLSEEGVLPQLLNLHSEFEKQKKLSINGDPIQVQYHIGQFVSMQRDEASQSYTRLGNDTKIIVENSAKAINLQDVTPNIMDKDVTGVLAHPYTLKYQGKEYPIVLRLSSGEGKSIFQTSTGQRITVSHNGTVTIE